MASEGDLIVLINDQNGKGKGLTGTLIRGKDRYGDLWFIKFDEKQTWAHDGDGSMPDGYGWFVELENVAPIMKSYDPTQGNEEDDV